jgi:putative transposase
MDSQRVKTTEAAGGIKGYDGGKQVKGRKRQVLVDPRGLLLSVEVTPANTSDQAGARRRLCRKLPKTGKLLMLSDFVVHSL